jgi:MFS family permease
METARGHLGRARGSFFVWERLPLALRSSCPYQLRDGASVMTITVPAPSRPARFRPASLDAINFLLADVRGALGPYLSVFLVTQRGWSQSSVGLMTTIAGLIGLAAQMPAGAAIDATQAKRSAIVLALTVLALGAIIIFAAPSFWPVLAANTVLAVVGDIFGPAVAALTLGLFAHHQLANRMGRNAAFDHAGNVAIAVVAGGAGWLFGQRSVFLLVPLFAVLATGAVLSIPAAAIDHGRARGADPDCATQEGSSWRMLIECRPLVVFAGCAMLFHFANAPLLPLVGQKLAISDKELATPMMSSCIVAAQLVMLPIALFAGRKADRWGRKPILLVGFAILPVRAVLYTFSDDSTWLIAVQLLDGVGAGIFGALTPLVVADLMRGTGRYNLALGGVATVQGIGASLSGLAAGLIVDHFGYGIAFITAGAVAGVALLALALAMPETAPAQGAIVVNDPNPTQHCGDTATEICTVSSGVAVQSGPGRTPIAITKRFQAY